ncbi:hypothetical protein LSTR_LSTR010304 [Laodelphax striatellus]|uniref:Peptidase M3A/M3B catalytic domain-containing protein n=1 Tax=Laodelphax striatellus TaxID=195883 RepID=A0A482XTZ4_LAOST|nr:hypothetical protein LSTR_LSTR010304 [Laodelphax striatellus]
MILPNSLQCLSKHSHTVLASSVKFSKLIKNLSLEGRSWVSTSALATTFNSKPERKLKFGFSKNETGLFEIPELQSPDGFHLLKNNVLYTANELVEESHSPNRSRKIVEIFDELSDTLCKVADLAEFIRIAHPDPKFAKAARDTCIVVSGIVEKMNTNKNLYLSLKQVVENGDKFPTTEIDDHVNKLFLEDFEQCGIHLEEEKRKLVVALNDCILQKGQEFMAAAVQPRVAPSEIIPKNIQHFFYVEGDKTIISGLCSELPNEVAREAAFKIFLYPVAEQEELLTEILEARYKLAQLCGFQSYAHRALKLSLAETPENVRDFLNLLSKELRPRAENEFNVMMKMKEVENDFTPLRPWDIPYFAKKGKKNLLKVESGEFSPYFSLGACMEGLNFLFTKLYGVHFENEPVKSGECWAPDIHKLAVVHESGEVLGHIYCDFFERDNKPNQDCHFTIRGGKQLADGTYQNPVVVLMLNLVPPRWSGPSLLTPGNVENLFHEMGHAMHSMFARTQYQHVTGTRCSTDFAEVPSVLMEFFASDPRVLRSFAKHFMTQEPMPDDMLNRLCASKRMFAASEMQLQVFYSVLDQTYHGEFPLKGSTTEILAETQKQHYCVPYVPNTAWQ